jgi:hypothetical protein
LKSLAASWAGAEGRKRDIHPLSRVKIEKDHEEENEDEVGSIKLGVLPHGPIGVGELFSDGELLYG